MDTLDKGKVPLKKKEKAYGERRWPYMIMQKVGDNAYKIELSGDMSISATFNFGDITPYIEDKDESYKDSRPNSPQGGG